MDSRAKFQYWAEMRGLSPAQQADAPDIPEILGNATDIVQPEGPHQRVLYKVWVEIERCIYDEETGDESDYVDVGMDFLDGAHVAEFMAGSPSPLADELAQHYVTVFGNQLQHLARGLAPDHEIMNRAVQTELAKSDQDADGNGGA